MPIDPAALGDLFRVLRGEHTRPPAARPPAPHPAAAPPIPAGLFPSAPAAAAPALPAGLFPELTRQLQNETEIQNFAGRFGAAPQPIGPGPGPAPSSVESMLENQMAAYEQPPEPSVRRTAAQIRETARANALEGMRRIENSFQTARPAPAPAPAARVTTRERGTIPGIQTPPPTTGPQPITPSRATQPQMQRIAPPAPRPRGFSSPGVPEWITQHLPGVTPDQFHERYFAGFVPRPVVGTGSGRVLSMAGDVRAPHDMVVPARGTWPEIRVPAGTHLGAIERTIYPQSRRVYNNYFSIGDQYQGLGIARTIIRNQVDIYRQMGNIDRVDVSAALGGGGHTWARFGFVPSASSWRNLRPVLEGRLSALANLDPVTKRAAEALIRSNDPISIRRLAELPMRPGSGKSDLGRKLLAGTTWSGTLDLRNPETMRYFDDYTNPNRQQR